MKTIAKPVFTTKIVPVADLKYSSLFKLTGVGMDMFYVNEALHFGYYEFPVVSEGLIVYTNADSVKAAKKIGLEEMEVVMVSDIEADDLPRFINFHRLRKRLTEYETVVVLRSLREYLESNEKGKLWALELSGIIREKKLEKGIKKNPDINDIVASVMGMSKDWGKKWVRFDDEARKLIADELGGIVTRELLQQYYKEYKEKDGRRTRWKNKKQPIQKTLFHKKGFAPHIMPNEPELRNNYDFFRLQNLSFKIEEVREDLLTKERLVLQYLGQDLPLRFEHQFEEGVNEEVLNFYDEYDNKLRVQIRFKDLFNLVAGANRRYK